MAISPLVAIITGAVSALFLLVALLVIALRLRCRTRRDPNSTAAGQRSRTATDVTKSTSRDMGPSACSETLLLAKSEQRSSTPLFNVENDESNPDLIPQQDGTCPAPPPPPHQHIRIGCCYATSRTSSSLSKISTRLIHRSSHISI